MKKFNWKLLLVVVMVLVLVVCVVACNNDKNNNKKPNKPFGGGTNKPASYVEQKAFMDDLYDVTKGIGNEGTVGSGQDLYLDIDLGVALGTRSAATASDGKRVNLGIALKGIIDRSNKDGRNTALEVKLSRTNGTILDLFYVAADNAMYVEFGGQKTTVNIDLIGLDDILFNGKTGLFNKDITLYVKGAKGDTKKGDTVDEAGYKIVDGKRVDGKDPKILLDEEGYQLKNGERVVKSGSPFTVNGLIDDIAGTAGKDFEVEDLIAVIVEKLGGLGDIGGMLGTLGFTDKQGNLDLYAALHNDLVCSLVNIPASENTGNNHKAIISLGPNSTGTIGSMLGGALGSLGLGDNDGLDVGISFKTAQDGALDGSLTVSADFVIDSKSPAHEFVEQSGNKDLFPFVELSFNSLKFAPAAGKSVAPANKADYANNLQLVIDEQIDITGLYVAVGLSDGAPKNLRLYASADLDLKNVENNTSQVYAYLKVTHVKNDAQGGGPYEITFGEGMPFELLYKNGALTVRTDHKASILNVAGGALNAGYEMLLANPVGNLIDGLLSDPKYTAQKAAFDEMYWLIKPDENGEGGKWNTGFQGVTINNLPMKNIIDMIGDAISAPKAEEPETPPTSGQEPAEEAPAEPALKLDIKTGKGNILTTIMYAIQLIDSDPGVLNLTSKDGLVGTIVKFGKLAMGVSGTDWDVEKLIPAMTTYIDGLLKGLTGGAGGVKEVFVLEGITTNDIIERMVTAFEEKSDAIKINFDFTEGFNWDIKLLIHEDPEISISWKSEIGFGSVAVVKDIKERIAENKAALDTAVAEGGSLYVADATARSKRDAAQATYRDTNEYKEWNRLNSAVKSAKQSWTYDLVGSPLLELSTGINQYIDGVGFFNAVWEYMRAKYFVEKDDSAENKAALTAAENALLDLFRGDSPKLKLKDGKSLNDVTAAADMQYETFKTTNGKNEWDLVAATAANEATQAYKDYTAAQAELDKAAAMLANAREQLTVYTRYTKLTEADDFATAVEEKNIPGLKQTDDAWWAALKTLTDYIDGEIAKVKDASQLDNINSKYTAYLDLSKISNSIINGKLASYLKYSDTKKDGQKDYTSSFKPTSEAKALAKALYAGIYGADSSEKTEDDYVAEVLAKIGVEGESTLINQAFIDAYCAAFDQSYNGAGTVTATANVYQAGITSISEMYVWCEITL